MSLRYSFVRTALTFVALCGLTSGANSQAPKWVPHGPGPNTDGQVEKIANGEVVGAINALAPHPTNADILYVGAVNGGIWKTINATAAAPNWVPQTDGHRSLSIGALEFDPTDSSRQTLLAGTGRFSSIGDGGGRVGVLRTVDGGAKWVGLDGGGALKGLNIAGVAARGAVLVIAVNTADNFSNVGIWRSADTGVTWTKISGAKGTGLPTGEAFDLAGDPNNPKRLFTNGGTSGLYRSDDVGATWTKVSDADMDGLIADANNVEIAVGTQDNLFVAVVNFNRLSGVYRSANGGGAWKKMDLPTTADGGIHPGGQGSLHLSIAADPGNTNLVYIGGDRQDSPFPNAIGARDYSGNLFRGDASKPAGKQWAHLTHLSDSSGGGTASGSAPHADSRDMKFAANGVLIEVDDGGIYRRTDPQTNKGDWFSMIGNLQTTEFHAIAWDSNSHIVIGGAQDTGSSHQLSTGALKWRSVSTADGGVVAVDDTGTPGLSTRYSSNQFLSGFRRRVYNAANVLQSQIFPPLTVVNGGNDLEAQFYTPIKLNSVNPSRLIIAGDNSVYESLDQGDTLTEIGPGIRGNAFVGNPIAYGSVKNPDVLYLGADDRVLVRNKPHPSPLTASASYPGGVVMGLAADPIDPQIVYVIDPSKAFRSTDGGANWTDITGNLAALVDGRLRSIAFATGPTRQVVVGAEGGVFTALESSLTVWSSLAPGLPRAPVVHLEFDAADQVVLAGTLGRGAWTVSLTQIVAGGPAKAPEVKPMTSVQLRSGTVVDLSRNLVYTMNPTGGIDAVALKDGQVHWHSGEASKPLGLVGDRLLGQAEAPGANNTLKVAALNPTTGAKLVTAAVDLPPGVRPMVQQTSKGEFLADIASDDNAADDIQINWQFTERVKRGLPPGTEKKLQLGGPKLPDAAPAPTTKKKGGIFRINLKTGAVAALDVADPPKIKPLTQLKQAKGNLAANQVLSADGKHIASSKRVGDDKVWDKYLLTVTERESDKVVGEFKSPIAAFPFVVTDSRIIFESGPFIRRTDKGLIEEPLRIRAIDLRTGEELWTREVRDIVYRGPLPP